MGRVAERFAAQPSSDERSGSGLVQSHYRLPVSPKASELAELPKQSATTNSEQLVKLTLDAIGNLQAASKECGSGIAWWSEWTRCARARTLPTRSSRPSPSWAALSSFDITRAGIVNPQQTKRLVSAVNSVPGHHHSKERSRDLAMGNWQNYRRTITRAYWMSFRPVSSFSPMASIIFA